ncbi:glycosyltransferase family 2 protein [Sphaerotilus microaerophilus]|uniref:Glycosyl transferase n=1 Tax=Sphaerotilus microaerophilus TaxID=2914710 RepID=A0ABM7YJW8_9BURK|nr:glycosyltransferase family 2 protein [Sphaerotilus sp. FB-5]BDI04557.1 glycosyl transferase [Sphaerotilus sp. FB-5]
MSWAHILFWSALVVLVYTYAGYPLWLALRARLAPRPPQRREGYRPRVAILVVVHNEAARIAAKIDSCLAQDYPADRLRVLVVSDGSTDRTADVVAGYADRRVSWLPCAQRRGKAACLNDGVAACDDEVIVFTDARQRLSADAVSRLVAVLSDPAYGAVSGELVFVKDEASAFGEGVDAYWRYEKFIRRHEALVGSVVGVTGALYALRRECFRPIPSHTILDDVAIPMQVVMQGRRVGFEPGAIAFDRPAQDVSQERSRKVRTLAGNFQLLQLFPALMLPWRNPLFGALMSHKLLRLAAPWAMLACLLANAALVASGSLFFQGIWVLHFGLYVLGLLGAVPGLADRVKLVRIAHAFLVLNWFAVLALREFLVNRQAHLWKVNTISAGPGSTS